MQFPQFHLYIYLSAFLALPIIDKCLPSRQMLVLRTSRGRSPPTYQGSPLKILFDRPGDILIWNPGDVPIWRPGKVLKWCPWDVPIWRLRDFPERLIRDVPQRTFRVLTCMSTFSQPFLQILFDWPNLSNSISTLKVYWEPVKLLMWSIFFKISKWLFSC